MRPDSSEQESYSLDEMLERLKDGEREKRESQTSKVVTRPDGSKVRRVRKRKRRTDQPEPAVGWRPSRKVVLAALVLGVVVLVAAGLGVLLRVAKFNSEGFQNELEQGLTDSLGATVSLQRMSVTPANAHVEKVSMRWPDGTVVQSALFEKVKAPVGMRGLVKGRWSGYEVVAKEGLVRVIIPRALTEPTRTSELPLGHERFRCERTDAHFGGGKEPAFRIEGADMTVTKGAKDATQVIMRGGRAFLQGCEPLGLDIGTVRITGNELKLTALRLRERNGKGAIEVSGLEDVRPGETGVLAFRLSEMPLGPLLGRDVGEIFNAVGNNSGGRVEIDASGNRPVEFRMPVTGTNATLRGFPFLMSLKTMFGHTDYGSPVFDEFSVVVHRVGGQVRLEKLDLIKRNALIIRGDLAFGPGEAVSGLLQVGVPERRMITRTDRKRWASFEKGADGMYWVEIAVGGILDDLDDNLEETLRKASLEASERRPGE